MRRRERLNKLDDGIDRLSYLRGTMDRIDETVTYSGVHDDLVIHVACLELGLQITSSLEVGFQHRLTLVLKK